MLAFTLSLFDGIITDGVICHNDKCYNCYYSIYVTNCYWTMLLIVTTVCLIT